eukprot:CAMPEP_0176305712 /NCGR_PEP_ID=MMETSP0121_2-20121125/63103_1 /TAXON_ID=160619 /ORGANISM="Kryptoperidinium foliaceum, Strain CCMP 1326" /LENGTH=47 /DNA_ID= /DNA_START= /DNA_END= /DNA_ORIENTATION=
MDCPAPMCSQGFTSAASLTSGAPGLAAGGAMTTCSGAFGFFDAPEPI